MQIAPIAKMENALKQYYIKPEQQNSGNTPSPTRQLDQTVESPEQAEDEGSIEEIQYQPNAEEERAASRLRFAEKNKAKHKAREKAKQ